MSVQSNSIKVGSCYAVENQAGPSKPDQHRRVVAIKNGKVAYESWGSAAGDQDGTLFRNDVDLGRFAEVVKKEIPCPTYLPAMPNLSKA